ncbi:uncharacterized protein BJ212DRAFT_1304335 [Suillus subaureus]|uniref:Uncharacterized protein n=1 Tax=Suillus subaureus TaxID=48587 RepID=A0A9P7DW29_9AGAM|nr:uncharacterized protein BJ212DRAFT_1304335 [Suillus subaureus]KAG1804315.1 hypothetical protein BJ212DRAFT_1304335 [Suillus subaureus]
MQVQHKRLGTQAGPVPCRFTVPLHEPSAPLSPDVQFRDPVQTSNCAVEQEMLDHSVLTGEDLDLMVYSSDLPNLGPNFHSPEALLAAVDHFSKYNAGTEAGAHLLTAHTAHYLPPDPEQCTEQADDNIIKEELLDVDAEFEDLQGYEDPGNAEPENVLVTTGQTNEDDLDPFITDDVFMKCGNDHSTKTPIVKYPYLSLSKQIKSMLKIPGLKAILDDWHSKPQSVGTYTDIFNADMCCKKLKDPNRHLFFSNSPGEKSGLNGSHISRVTLPHLIHHVQLHFQYVISPWSTGHLVHMILVAVICDEPAAHKIGGFASHLHTCFCMTCWIMTSNKDKPSAFQPGDHYRSNAQSFLSSCGKLPTDIGMLPGGSLTVDQWLLLSTIPQLWSTCLLTDASSKVLNQHLDVIQILETQKQVAASHKADNRKSLAKVKKQGTDAYALQKAQIAQEKLVLAKAKKTAKLKAAAAMEAEKLRLVAKKKACTAWKVPTLVLKTVDIW